MVYESGFSTRRTYSTRPIVSSYTVSNKKPIDWEKFPFVPRPTLIANPVTAFGRGDARQSSILNPINRAAIRPSYKVLNGPIQPYVSARDKNRERIFGMVHQYIETVAVGGNTAARTAPDSMDTVLPRLHRAASTGASVSRVHHGNDFLDYGGQVKRETFVNDRSGATTPRLDLCTDRPGQHRSHGSSDYSYSYKSNVEKSSYDSSNPYARPERSSYSSSVESSSRSGPGGAYNYNTERTSTTGAGPGGYSYSSTTTGNLPGGTRYRHFSYRV